MQALLVIRARQFEGPSLKEKPQRLGPQTCVQAPSREILATRFCYSEPEDKGKGSFQISPVSGRITASPQLFAKFPQTVACVHQIFIYLFFRKDWEIGIFVCSLCKALGVQPLQMITCSVYKLLVCCNPVGLVKASLIDYPSQVNWDFVLRQQL